MRGRNPPEEEETDEVRESRVLGVWLSSNQEPVEEIEEAVSERSDLIVSYCSKLRLEREVLTETGGSEFLLGRHDLRSWLVVGF